MQQTGPPARPDERALTIVTVGGRVRAPFVLSLCLSLTVCDRSITHDVHDNALLRDRIIAAVPRGTDTGQARRLLTREGFTCTFHLGADVDTLAKDVETPSDRLTCLKDVNAQPETADGYRRYVVDLLAPGARVERVETRMWMDRKP